MLKRMLFALLLTLSYLAVFAVGSFLHPFNRVQTLGSHGLAVRLFIWDGLLLMLGLFGLSILVEFLGKRLRDLAGWTTVSLIGAAVLSYLLRLGFVTREF